MDDNLLVGTKRIVPCLRNSSLYLLVLIIWASLFQLCFLLLYSNWDGNLKSLNLQVIIFNVSTNLGALGFTWWALRTARINYELFTKESLILFGMKYENGIISIFGIYSIFLIIISSAYGNIAFTLNLSILLTNVTYITMGFLGYRFGERLSLKLIEGQNKVEKVGETAPKKVIGLELEESLDG